MNTEKVTEIKKKKEEISTERGIICETPSKNRIQVDFSLSTKAKEYVIVGKTNEKRIQEKEAINSDLFIYMSRQKGCLNEDIPLRIINARKIENDIQCLLDWERRGDGFQPDKSYVSAKILRKK